MKKQEKTPFQIFADAKLLKKMKVDPIVIFVHGGLVQWVCADHLQGRPIVVVDGDTEGCDEEELANGYAVTLFEPGKLSDLHDGIPKAVQMALDEIH
jgi:hypothetical protein